MVATPFFCFQAGFSAKKTYSISQETESCRRLCWVAAGQKDTVKNLVFHGDTAHERQY